MECSIEPHAVADGGSSVVLADFISIFDALYPPACRNQIRTSISDVSRYIYRVKAIPSQASKAILPSLISPLSMVPINNLALLVSTPLSIENVCWSLLKLRTTRSWVPW